jgi:hypothetical protein
LYPLVYGRSKVLKDEVVGVRDAIAKWAGKGDVILGEDDRKLTEDGRPRYDVISSHIPPNYWSVNYQWLPSNVAFQGDGTVRFTSYINNLHPANYPEIYRAIERLIDTSMPMWDQCLTLAVDHMVQDGPGRTSGRFGIPSDPE